MILIAVCLVVGAWAHAQNHDHQHGVNVPDWYDWNCCNNQDCRPVDNPDDIEPMMLGIEPAIRYKPTGTIFTRDRFKVSKDERYHVCIHYSGNPLCIYVPAMI